MQSKSARTCKLCSLFEVAPPSQILRSCDGIDPCNHFVLPLVECILFRVLRPNFLALLASVIAFQRVRRLLTITANPPDTYSSLKGGALERRVLGARIGAAGYGGGYCGQGSPVRGAGTEHMPLASVSVPALLHDSS